MSGVNIYEKKLQKYLGEYFERPEYNNRDRYDIIKSAVTYTVSFAEDENKSIEDIERKEIMRYIYSRCSSNQNKRRVLNEATRYIEHKGGNDIFAKDVGDVYGDNNTSESDVVNLCKENIDYDDTEYRIATERMDKDFMIDIVRDDYAIECKGSRYMSICKAAHQCMTYRLSGFTPVLITSMYWDSLIEIFEELEIAMIYADVKDESLTPLLSFEGLGVIY